MDGSGRIWYDSYKSIYYDTEGDMVTPNLHNRFSPQRVFPTCAYYHEQFFPDQLINDPKECQRFIHRYFKMGCKDLLLDLLPFKDTYEEKGKHQHTVLVYLLGLYLQDLFKDQIEAVYGQDNRLFEYLWFLTCLYHDVASCVEKTDDVYATCCSVCPNNSEMQWKGCRFSHSTVCNYCRYRKKSGSQDHGIYGGLQLYEQLKRNFLIHTKGHDWKTDPICERNGLIWKQEHKKYYALAAQAIICHNMWTVKESDETGSTQYLDAGLEELIIHDEQQKLSRSAYPLDYMLCLLDSIEPIKRFNTVFTANELLKKIDITCSAESIKICWDNDLKKQGCFWEWMKTIYTMPDWMNVSVEDGLEKNSCVIKIA